ncbi:cysteine synthase family protein [Pontibacter sp. G13]|uniref:PLP-dependent cysteine synthase family protein n=1 Tax=Pontibacter sp. G13 TaxID=3074898 RepID=UPI00288BEE4B|nr:cysteine synthase family protein [Pontibacter sp. G13]WNJ18827.1 cysteine synthase family protein [Pontibacter sp. G13]
MNTSPMVVDPKLIRKLDEAGKLIGNTPLMRIQRAWSKPGVELYAKCEWAQLGQSVKARPAFSIFKAAILNGDLPEGRHLMDASSGNTAIAYAAIGARLDIPVTIFLPENASETRKLILRSFGAHLILTDPLEGMDGAQRQARELAANEPEKYFHADQYNNDNNWKAHYRTTANEIYRQTQGRITHLVATLGTSGTFMGNSRKLRELNPDIEMISIQPDSAMHALEGWKHMETALVPGIYDPNQADRTVIVSTEEAYDWVKRVAKTEGILLSPSAAGNLAGAVKVAQELEEGVVVTTFADDYAKYGEVMNEIFS